MARNVNFLSVNLRLLCSRSSVADVCRRIGINRQQFNKYLAGTSAPSRRSLTRICDFFDLDPEDVDLAPLEFANLLKTHQDPMLSMLDGMGGSSNRDPATLAELDRYCGIYQTYQHVPNTTSSILVGLCQIKREGNQFLSKYIEVARDNEEVGFSQNKSKMLGIVTLEGGFIYILDRKTGTRPSYSLTILFPYRSPKIHMVTGMTLSISHHLSGSPYSANIVYERLAKRRDIWQATRKLRLYSNDKAPLSEEIKHIITNRIRNDQRVLSHFFL